jgi:hypothetical protein
MNGPAILPDATELIVGPVKAGRNSHTCKRALHPGFYLLGAVDQTTTVTFRIKR